MSYKLVYDEKFIKKSAKFLKKHPDLKERYYKRYFECCELKKSYRKV